MSYRSAAAALVIASGFAVTAAAQDKSSDTIPCAAIESIGTAEMSADGVITLHLGSLWPDPIAEGEIRYAPDDPQYEEIKQHLGGIAPGETKPVKPWC
ncbi:MAG: hypothetical protein WCA56_02130 [Xanthobacteraceae bacterium]|jgi:hypothetical protein